VSIASIAISEVPVAAEPPRPASSTGRGKPPPRRTAVATSDVISAPEAR